MRRWPPPQSTPRSRSRATSSAPVTSSTVATPSHSTSRRSRARRTLEDRGVELAQQPDERFYGVDATVRDPTGNLWRIVQPIEVDLEALQQG